MKKTLLAFAAAGTLLAGCSSVGLDSGNALEHWANYSSDSLNASNLNASNLNKTQALAVFYRTAEYQGAPLNVYINGAYQTSLLEKSYSPVAVCANQQRISASYTTNLKFGNRTSGLLESVPAQTVVYYRATKDAKGNPTFERVSEEVARAELAGLKGKTDHVLSRVDSSVCKNVALNKAVIAGAQWGLNKYAYPDMLDQGKREIAEYVQFVKGNNDIGRIEVAAYTDPEASVAYNLALSQKRADTVRQALIDAGVTQPIKAVGYGKTNLIVSNCAELHKNKADRAACNLPNRRVEITSFNK